MSSEFFLGMYGLTTGDIQKIRENGATTGVGVLATYAYDNLGNRASLTFGNGVVQTYGVDPISRLAGLTTSHRFGVNSLNQYISNNDGTTTKTLTYDRNGNLTSDGTNSFCYSSENLLKGMNGTCAAPSVSLAYDPLARKELSAPSPENYH